MNDNYYPGKSHVEKSHVERIQQQESAVKAAAGLKLKKPGGYPGFVPINLRNRAGCCPSLKK
jgi:hypothetical protein